MSFERLLKFFGPVRILDLPEILSPYPDLFGEGYPNSGGIHVKQVMWRFDRHMLVSAALTAAPAGRIYIGVARKHVPQELVPYIGPIYFAQWQALFHMQPEGGPGHLIGTGWWNSARIRGDLESEVATARFSNSDKTPRKKTLFTMSADPKGKGWVVDSLPYSDPKWYAQGRRIIFSEPIPG